MSSPACRAACHSTNSSSARSRSERRAPAQLAFGVAGVQLQAHRLGRIGPLVDLPPKRALPQLREPSDDPLDRHRIARPRAEVPGPRGLGALAQPLGEQQVAAERVEHVLPGAHRMGVSHQQRPVARLQRPQGVGQQPVLAPVARLRSRSRRARWRAGARPRHRRTSACRRRSRSSAQALELE